jgi:head-tail adaptor
MCAALGIKIIPASSPQAKGRIERNHGTHQDRLVKKLRRKKIADVASANAFLDTEYWADHNRRFAQAPASADDFHVAVPRGVQLDTVFRLEEKRTVSNDWVVRYDNRLLQIERQSHRPPARSSVRVFEDVAGQLEIRYRDRVMRWTELAIPVASKPARPPARPVQPAPVAARQRRPGADHPWRRAVEQFRIDQQLAADRKAYAAVNP